MEVITINENKKRKNIIISTIGLIINIISLVLYILTNLKAYNIPYIGLMSLFLVIMSLSYIEIINEKQANKISDKEKEKNYHKASKIALISSIVGLLFTFVRFSLILINLSDKFYSYYLMFMVSVGSLLYYVGVNNLYLTMKNINNKSKRK